MENKPPSYYQLILEKDLLGGWAVVREWGRQDAAGRVKREHFSDLEAAQSALMQIRDKQLARGYKVVFIQGQDHLT